MKVVLHVADHASKNLHPNLQVLAPVRHWSTGAKGERFTLQINELNKIPVSRAANPRGIIELKSNIIVGQFEAESKLIGVINPLANKNREDVVFNEMILCHRLLLFRVANWIWREPSNSKMALKN